jgi:hypothetical protein
MSASHQLVELIDSLEEWHREPNENDQWVYIWGSGIFTSKQVYEIHKGEPAGAASVSVDMEVSLSRQT